MVIVTAVERGGGATLQGKDVVFAVTVGRYDSQSGVTDLLLRERYSVAGRLWELNTNSAELRVTARHELGDEIYCQNGGPDLKLNIRVSDVGDGRAWPSPLCRGCDHLVFTRLSDASALVYEYSRRQVVGEVSSIVAADRDYWKNIVFPFALGVMSPVLATTPLHAGCFVYDGCSVLIGGRSDAGKSTLTAAFARRGATFVSDDWVYRIAESELQVDSRREAAAFVSRETIDNGAFARDLLSILAARALSVAGVSQ